MARALASHHRVRFPDSMSYAVEFVVRYCPFEGFPPGSAVFLPPQKPTFPNSNSIWNPRATGLAVVRLLGVTVVKQS